MAKPTRRRRKRATATPAIAGLWRFDSDFPECTWPAIGGPDSNTNTILALYFQMLQSEWVSSQDLNGAALEQLQRVITHAGANVHFRQLFANARIDPNAALSAAAWERLPLTLAEDLQPLVGRATVEVPPAHGGDLAIRWDPLAALPVVPRPMIGALIDAALLLREYQWHGRSPADPTVRVRTRAEEQGSALNVRDAFEVAMASVIDSAQRTELPADARAATISATLSESRATILECDTEELRELIRYWEAHDGAPAASRLRIVRCHGAFPDRALRRSCAEHTGAGLKYHLDLPLTGAIAVECGEAGALHVQAEHVYAEIVDPVSARTSESGQSGLLVVTDLHNLRLPILRFSTGWRARFGEPCACGRGLPVVTDLQR